MNNQPMKYLIPRRTSSAVNNTADPLKTFRAIIAGRKMSVTDPFSAPYFSARVASGHRHLLRIKVTPSMKMVTNAMSKTQLKVLVTPA